MLSSLFSDPVGAIYSILLNLPGVIIAISFHEFAHGYVAYKLGDPTAKLSGRLSLNPLHHLDPFGLLMLVIFRFGWAKPVQVNTRYFKNPKRDMVLTSLAGPVMNFITAFFMLVIAYLFELGYNSSYAANGATVITTAIMICAQVFFYACLINLGLGIFNLIPIPPLDGWKVLGSFLPAKTYFTLMNYERYGMIILILLLMTGTLSIPLGYLNSFIYNFYYDIISFIFSIFGV